jgi:uncharacterized protein (DUF305 family)
MVAWLLTATAGASCRAAFVDAPPIVQPGAPGAASQVITAARAVEVSGVRATAADVRFMQGMIGHHAQALEMTALVASRSSREDMRLLGQRIALSQADEIAAMRQWLQAWGQALPDPHAHHAPGAPLMPGMLTDEEMRQLEEARDEGFDRLFLEYMIRHHEGALVMVEQLFSSAGAANEPEVFAFASDVDADQRMEIERMGAMLKEMER